MWAVYGVLGATGGLQTLELWKALGHVPYRVEFCLISTVDLDYCLSSCCRGLFLKLFSIPPSDDLSH